MASFAIRIPIQIFCKKDNKKKKWLESVVVFQFSKFFIEGSENGMLMLVNIYKRDSSYLQMSSFCLN